MSDPRCAKCGHPRSNHPYRHPFVGPSLEDDVKALTSKLAECEARLGKAVEALEDISSNGNAAGRNPQLMADKASATLAEISSHSKGESHE